MKEKCDGYILACNEGNRSKKTVKKEKRKRGQGAFSGGFASLARPIWKYIGPALNETKTK
jgi:hypothetical protein